MKLRFSQYWSTRMLTMDNSKLARQTLTLLFAALALSSCARTDEHGPSAGASEMPGATGTIVFKPDDWIEGTTTWWLDSDGIDPGTPGCHIGTDESGTPNGRMFGEACLPNGLLAC